MFYFLNPVSAFPGRAGRSLTCTPVLLIRLSLRYRVECRGSRGFAEQPFKDTQVRDVHHTVPIEIRMIIQRKGRCPRGGLAEDGLEQAEVGDIHHGCRIIIKIRIAHVAVQVPIGIALVGVGDQRAVVGGVEDGVVVIVVVAGIAEAVAVGVEPGRCWR